MTKNPIKIEKDTLATKALSIMNEKKLQVCVFIIERKISYDRNYTCS